MACTMFRVRKGEYQCFSSTITLAQIARRSYPELKGGHIAHVLQMLPSVVKLGRLYKGDDIQPDRNNLRARNVMPLCEQGVTPGYCCLYHHTGGPITSRCGSDIAR
jgi:hypothetical protein